MVDQIKTAAALLARARSLFVLTGAGISAESKIPTFRGKDGLWKNYSATELATPEAFAKDPQLVWDWYRWRQEIIRNASPNPGHYALVELEKKFDDFMILTQNVDNLHQRAGSRKILELHGNIFKTRCLSCNKITDPQFSSPLMGEEKGEGEKISDMLQCQCGGLLRPDVVWFGEPIPQDIWQTSMEFLSTADAALICGTSGVVWPAAAIPQIAKNNNAKIIEINLEPTPISSLVDTSIIGKSGEVLPAIVERL